MNNHRIQFEKELCDRSISDDLEEAVQEWRTLHHHKYKEPQYCICGHHIKHVIPIFNIHNHKCFLVGDSCAKKHNIKEHLSNELLFSYLNGLLEETTDLYDIDIDSQIVPFINTEHQHLKQLLVENDEVNYFDVVLPLCKLNENIDDLIQKFGFDLVEIHNSIIADVYLMNEKITALENGAKSEKKHKHKKSKKHKKKKSPQPIQLEPLDISNSETSSTSEETETYFESPFEPSYNEIIQNVLESILEKMENPEYLEENSIPENEGQNENFVDGSQTLENNSVLENTFEDLGEPKIENIELESLEEIPEKTEDGSPTLENDSDFETISEDLGEPKMELIRTEYLEEIENKESLEENLIPKNEGQNENFVDCSPTLENDSVLEKTIEVDEEIFMEELENREYLEEIEEKIEDGSPTLENDSLSENTAENLEESKIEFLTSDSSEESENQESLGKTDSSSQTSLYDFDNDVEDRAPYRYRFQTKLGKEVGEIIDRVRTSIRELRRDMNDYSNRVRKAKLESDKRHAEIQEKYDYVMNI